MGVEFYKGDKVRVIPTPWPGVEKSINLSKGTWDRLVGREGEVDAIRAPTHFFPSGMVHVVFARGEAWWVVPAYLRKGDPVGIVFVEEGAPGAPEG